jgi:hypothetical protein
VSSVGSQWSPSVFVKPNQEPPIAEVAGLSIAGGVLILFGAAVIWFCRSRRRRKASTLSERLKEDPEAVQTQAFLGKTTIDDSHHHHAPAALIGGRAESSDPGNTRPSTPAVDAARLANTTVNSFSVGNSADTSSTSDTPDVRTGQARMLTKLERERARLRAPPRAGSSLGTHRVHVSSNDSGTVDSVANLSPDGSHAGGGEAHTLRSEVIVLRQQLDSMARFVVERLGEDEHPREEQSIGPASEAPPSYNETP